MEVIWKEWKLRSTGLPNTSEWNPTLQNLGNPYPKTPPLTTSTKSPTCLLWGKISKIISFRKRFGRMNPVNLTENLFNLKNNTQQVKMVLCFKGCQRKNILIWKVRCNKGRNHPNKAISGARLLKLEYILESPLWWGRPKNPHRRQAARKSRVAKKETWKIWHKILKNRTIVRYRKEPYSKGLSFVSDYVNSKVKVLLIGC